MGSRAEETEGADLMKLLGNRIRWRLLQELARSDRRVQELAALLAQPQNLVSYHLGLLRMGHVISERRGDQDGRDVYYSLDLDKLQLTMERAVADIHPALSGVPVARGADRSRSTITPRSCRILFVSLEQPDWARIVAVLTNELSRGTLRALSHGGVDAFAAALERSGMCDAAVQSLQQLGFIVNGTEIKAIGDYWGTPMDYVVTFSESGQSSLHAIGGRPQILHWSAPPSDPAHPPTADDYHAFALQVTCRVRQLLALVGTDRTAENR